MSNTCILWYEIHLYANYVVGQSSVEIITILLQDNCTPIAPLLPPPFSKTENRGGVLSFNDRGRGHFTCTLCVWQP
jgi:hypothetical protein